MVGYSNPGKYVDCSYTGKIVCETGSLGGSDASKTYTLETTAKPCTVVSGSKVKGTSVTSITSADTERYLVGGTNTMTVNAANTSIVTE